MSANHWIISVSVLALSALLGWEPASSATHHRRAGFARRHYDNMSAGKSRNKQRLEEEKGYVGYDYQSDYPAHRWCCWW